MATPMAPPRPSGAGHRPDDEIKAEIDDLVLPAVPDIDTSMVHIMVEDGTVWLVGRLDWCGQAEIVRTAVARVPGVLEVKDRIRCTWDDQPVYRWHPHLPHLHRGGTGDRR